MILTTPVLLHGTRQGRLAFPSVPGSGLGAQRAADANRTSPSSECMMNERVKSNKRFLRCEYVLRKSVSQWQRRLASPIAGTIPLYYRSMETLVTLIHNFNSKKESRRIWWLGVLPACLHPPGTINAKTS